MRMEQVNELKSDVEKLTGDSMLWKEKYYEQVSETHYLPGDIMMSLPS